MQQDEQDRQEKEHVPEAMEQRKIAPLVETGRTEEEISEELEQQLQAEQQKAEEYLNLLRRTQADFINYRRRVNQEQAEARIAAQSALLAQLLPALDDLERALRSTPADLREHSWARGLFLVERQLATVLEQIGVRQMGAPGEEFDPRRHEALAIETSSEVPAGAVLRVVRPGYLLGERVIRPAQVIVAGAIPSAEDVSATAENRL